MVGGSGVIGCVAAGLIDKLVDLFQTEECAKYFSSSGYDPE